MSLGTEISIVYMSCDKYSDLWVEYFKLFRLYWPECPFKIYVLSNSIESPVEGTVSLTVGEDLSWSDNLLNAIKRVETKYVFLLLDDFFLVDVVPHREVIEKLSWALLNEVNFLRLSPCEPKPTRVIANDIGLIPKGAIYRTSTRFPLWKVEVLAQILQRGESAWDFELAGSIRSDNFGGFYASCSEPFKFVNCIIKGRWDPAAVGEARKRGANLTISKRRMMTMSEQLMEKAYAIRSILLKLVPYRSRRIVRDRVHKELGHLLAWHRRLWS